MSEPTKYGYVWRHLKTGTVATSNPEDEAWGKCNLVPCAELESMQKRIADADEVDRLAGFDAPTIGRLIKSFREKLAEVGGMDNDLVSVPASSVRRMLDEFERCSARPPATELSNRLRQFHDCEDGDLAVEAADELDRQAAEIERLQGYETAYTQWSDKTDWVQEKRDWEFSTLGKHRADVMRLEIERISRLTANRDELLADLAAARAEVVRLNTACSRQQYEIQGTLARALGYGGTEEGQLPEWGDHTAETLADEIAAELAAARAELAMARGLLVDVNRMMVQRQWDESLQDKVRRFILEVSPPLPSNMAEQTCCDPVAIHTTGSFVKLDNPSIERDTDHCGGKELSAMEREAEIQRIMNHMDSAPERFEKLAQDPKFQDFLSTLPVTEIRGVKCRLRDPELPGIARPEPGAVAGEVAASCPQMTAGMLQRANEVLRSAYSVASRNGIETNWDSFRRMLLEILDEQQQVLHPMQPVADPREAWLIDAAIKASVSDAE